MRRVIILQEYVPQYRVPFFDALHMRAQAQGIDLVVAYGDPNRHQASRRDEAELSYGVRVPQREVSVLGRRIVFRRTRALIESAALVVVEQARRNIDSYGMLLGRRRRGPRIALWGHGKDYTRKSDPLSAVILRWITSRCDWFFAYTSGGKAAVAGMGFPANRITVVRNAIDTQALKADIDALDPAEIAAFRERHGLTEKTAVFLGATDDAKRPEFLMESADLAHGRDPDFRLLIVGAGPRLDDLAAWASNRGWVRCLGALQGRAKSLALAASQVIAMPGRVGLVAVDSFAAGVPIVTTSWPWHAPEFEYLKNGFNACISDDEPEAYAQLLVSALSDRLVLSTLRNGCLICATTTDISTMANNFLDGILAVLQEDQK